jgi:hypothetical protein
MVGTRCRPLDWEPEGYGEPHWRAWCSRNPGPYSRIKPCLWDCVLHISTQAGTHVRQKRGTYEKKTPPPDRVFWGHGKGGACYCLLDAPWRGERTSGRRSEQGHHQDIREVNHDIRETVVLRRGEKSLNSEHQALERMNDKEDCRAFHYRGVALYTNDEHGKI